MNNPNALPQTLDNLLPDSVSGFFREIGVKQWVKHAAGFLALFGSGIRIVHCLTGLSISSIVDPEAEGEETMSPSKSSIRAS